jgi:hypothetical protein
MQGVSDLALALARLQTCGFHPLPNSHTVTLTQKLIPAIQFHLPSVLQLCCNTHMNSNNDPLKDAATAVGGWAQLASLIGVTKSAVYQWKRVPAERVIAVERASGVPRQQLRPDLYPTE